MLANMTPDEVTRKGKEWYEKILRSRLETPENVGKFLVIDVENGEWEIGDRGDETLFRALAKHPNRIFHRLRIGYPATYSIGTSMKPTIRYGYGPLRERGVGNCAGVCGKH